MFGSLSFQEIAFILVLALLIFGPRRLPEMGKMLGRAMGEFRRASNELRRTFNAELAVEEEEQEPKPRRLRDSAGAKTAAAPPAEASEPSAPTEDAPEISTPRPAGAVARGEGAPSEPSSDEPEA
ncbi:MAG: twin-arginine translocase TatA/TatE family subunit [Acidobacteria bacterium]|nr:twin-arginine translocase TatA/TatE family subunit [Acidobacteriota bacterium]